MLDLSYTILLAVAVSIGFGSQLEENNPVTPAQNSNSILETDREIRRESGFETKVGYPGIIQGLVIPGPELFAKPIENRDQPVIIRIVETYPHGDGHRYDLEYVGLDPGTYDLADYLQHLDGQPISDMLDVPEIRVSISTLLPPGQIEPNQNNQRSTHYRSYYLAFLLIGGVIWVLGLLAILFAGRFRVGHPSNQVKTITVADRLKPLVERAVSGEMSVAEQAELERVLVAFWRKKLRLGHLPADRLRGQLRQHPEAGELLGQIDHWLHRPDPYQNVNIPELLQPYQSLNYDEI